MAARDFMPLSHALGGHMDAGHYRLNAAETFVIGEPVAVNADGELTESADDPVAADVIGIAAAPVAYTQNGVAVTPNPRTGANFALGDMVPVWHARPGVRFITDNFATDGAGTPVVPTLANALGERAGFTLAAGNWFLDTGTTNFVARIVDVLDAQRRSIQDPNFSGNAGVFVIFEIVQSALTENTAAVA